jgi:hypothetical protein
MERNMEEKIIVEITRNAWNDVIIPLMTIILPVVVSIWAVKYTIKSAERERVYWEFKKTIDMFSDRRDLLNLCIIKLGDNKFNLNKIKDDNETINYLKGILLSSDNNLNINPYIGVELINKKVSFDSDMRISFNDFIREQKNLYSYLNNGIGLVEKILSPDIDEKLKIEYDQMVQNRHWKLQIKDYVNALNKDIIKLNGVIDSINKKLKKEDKIKQILEIEIKEEEIERIPEISIAEKGAS